MCGSAIAQSDGQPSPAGAPALASFEIGRAGHGRPRFAGGERMRATEGVNRSTIAMAPPQRGQGQSGRGKTVGAAPVTVGESPVCPRSARQSDNNAARRRWAKKLKIGWRATRR